MNKMIQTTKELHPEDVCLFKIGTFYHAYARDAYIISYLFKYKLRDEEKDGKECGFPVNSIAKVSKKLEDEKINYVIIDNRNDYSVDEKSDNKNLNRYKTVYARARNYVNYKLRVDEIVKYLNENIDEKDFRKILAKVEDVIYEGGEIQSNSIH